MDVKGTREILFRGKRIDNGEWVEGYFVNLWLMHYQKHQPIITDNNAVSYDVDPPTVGQYTGLTDKNGKKIFEGDIVAIERGWNETVKYHVFFDPQICGFIGDSINYIGFTTFGDDGINMEVIGNIHDNPELLKDFNKGV